MPWKATSAMEERKAFASDHALGVFSFAELCRRFGVSRKTGYKWIRRYEEGGEAGLGDRSRRPSRVPHATPPEKVVRIVALRKKYGWGAKKLLKILERRDPEEVWPARSTVEDILKRAGCVTSRSRRSFPGHAPRPQTAMSAPNEVWTVDFKGEFKMGNGIYCYPLTVMDGFSRYLLACEEVLDGLKSGAGGLLEALPGAWLAADHSERQRMSFRDDGVGAPIALGGVVDPAGHHSGAQRAGSPGAERQARANASRAEASRDPTSAGKPRGSAASLQSVSRGVQRGEAARRHRPGDAREPLRGIRASESKSDAIARVSAASRAAPGEREWWHALGRQVGLRQSCTCRRGRRSRAGRRRSLGRLLRSREVGPSR